MSPADIPSAEAFGRPIVKTLTPVTEHDTAMRVSKSVPIETAPVGPRKRVRSSTRLVWDVEAAPPRQLTGEETGIVATAAQLAALFVTMDLDATGWQAVAVAVLTYIALRAVLRRMPPLR